MGCDIHLYSEVFHENSGEWVCADYYRPCPYSPYEGLKREEIDVGRNYRMFSILAGVRNYGHDVPLTMEPKDMPDDMSDMACDFMHSYGPDGHSHTYFTLQELYEMQEKLRETPTKVEGWITDKDAEALDKEGKVPDMWCGAVSPTDGYQKREWEMPSNYLDTLISELEDRAQGYFGLYRNWQTEKFDKEQAEKIRILMFFDN